ncbi:MraY family glycosyltransferase [Pseudomonas guariconensis]|uniref:MraY family glycosyltransferase n=1 Tax=Pseudomonas guariconensis TaxID=1288410 RepID=UPI003F690446
MLIWCLACVPVFIASYAGTSGLRRYALARQLLDVPNARSSHSQPTPRGGGVAIVLAYLLALVGLLVAGTLDSSWAWAMLGAGCLVAALGFLDDHGHIPARWRLLGHFMAAVWLMSWVGGLPDLEILGQVLNLGWVGYFFGGLYLVWMLNLYNFMDGIDGIASAEAITTCLGGALAALIGGHTALIAPALLLAAATSGFLLWNFPPARIFMGDAGSGFLGLMLAALSIQASQAAPELFWSWLILLGVFVVDATYTLMRRLLRGEKLYEAHRSHAYQFASRQHGRHLPVTVVIVIINVLWLLPLSLMVASGWLDGLTGILTGYFPLLLLAIKYNAGGREHR